MSSTVQHKLYELECTPPPGAWERIAAELDDLAPGMQFPARLREIAVDPPAHCWNTISSQLDTGLVADDIAAKLITAAAIPPAAAWNKIRASLDAGIIVPKQRKIIPWRRYAAAAAVIGLLTLGAARLLESGSDEPARAVVVPAEEKTETIVPVTGNKELQETVTAVNEATRNEDDARNDAALEASKKTYAKLDVPSRKKVNIAAEFSFSDFLPDETLGEHGSSGYEEALSSAGSSKMNRYIVLMTPDGHFIRMSKKLSDLVCCVSGEEEDEKCKTQVEKWRKQLAGSGASHPGNFMDILSMVGSLRDN